MNYLKNTFFIIVLIICWQGCKSQDKTELITNSETSHENTKWLDYINSASDAIQMLYIENAFKVLANGEILDGNQQIKNYFLQNSIAVKSIKTDTVIVANKRMGLEYEMGEFTDSKNKKYKHLIIWETKNLKRQRVFEFVEKVEPTNDVLSEIERRRKLWMQLCNNHNAAELINEMYSKNTIYYNHKPIVKGRDSLIPVYQYMNNEDYKLSLHPIIIEVVNKDFVFEIGQCKGSYNGKYILIWRKGENGKWEIFIDSNI